MYQNTAELGRQTATDVRPNEMECPLMADFGLRQRRGQVYDSDPDVTAYQLWTMVNVRIASPLRSYTGGAARVAAAGSTVAEVLADLESHYPGMRLRMIDEQD